MQVRFLNMGDSALTLELGDHIDLSLASRVAALDHKLRSEQAEGHLAGLIEAVPTYSSLTVMFNPLILQRTVLKARLLVLLEEIDNAIAKAVRSWQIPVCYSTEYGPDLATVADAKGLTSEEVIHLHSGRDYTVYMIGFLPGFPYMGDLDPALHMPRRSEPRIRVPIGSVAITGMQTAIYPWESPGGWQLLGRCPLPLFDADRSEPALFAQGDRVQFKPVSAKDFCSLVAAVQDGSLDITRFLINEVAA